MVLFARLRGLRLLSFGLLAGLALSMSCALVPDTGVEKSPRTCENFNLIPGDYDLAGLSPADRLMLFYLYARCVHERENKWCTPVGDEPVVAYRCKRNRTESPRP